MDTKFRLVGSLLLCRLGLPQTESGLVGNTSGYSWGYMHQLAALHQVGLHASGRNDHSRGRSIIDRRESV